MAAADADFTAVDAPSGILPSSDDLRTATLFAHFLHRQTDRLGCSLSRIACTQSFGVNDPTMWLVSDSHSHMSANGVATGLALLDTFLKSFQAPQSSNSIYDTDFHYTTTLENTGHSINRDQFDQALPHLSSPWQGVGVPLPDVHGQQANETSYSSAFP